MAMPKVDSWQELITATTQLVVNEIWHAQRILPTAPRRQIDSDRVVHDAKAGISQIGTFLRVIPEVYVKTDLVDPAADLFLVAARSKGFAINGAALDDTADSGLAYGLAAPKPATSAPMPYDILQYYPKWFTHDHTGGAVGLVSNVVTNLRGESGKHPNHYAQSGDIWFGCPAHKIIPRLYDHIVVLV